MNHTIKKLAAIFIFILILDTSIAFAEINNIQFPSCGAEITGNLSEVAELSNSECAQYSFSYEPDVLFHVMCFNIPDRVLEQLTTEQLLAETSKAIVKTTNRSEHEDLKLEITEEKKITKGFLQGYSVTLLSSQSSKTIKTNVFLNKQLFIGIIMIGPKGEVDSKEVQSIFESFTIL